jgi:hypothetical protein
MDINTQEQEDIIMFAFRYALGRRTGAPDTVVNIIERNCDIIKPSTIKQMQRETLRYQNMYSFDEVDWPTWQRILRL